MYCLSFALYERMMKWSRRRRRKVTHAPEIPEDLLIEILTRLPAKSVMRFKCISKLWSSLLSSRYVCNRYRSSRPPQARLYMSLIDLSETESLLLSSSPITSLSSNFLVFNQTIREIGGFSTHVLRGFICFTRNGKPQIYNPTTRQLILLPDIHASDLKAQEGRVNTVYFLCHDSIHDQYKILCTISELSNGTLQKFRSEHWVYLLDKAGGSWTRVAKEFPHHISNICHLTLDGVLYYLAWTDFSTCVLVSFDMSSEEFNMIQLPHDHRPRNVLPIENWKMKTQINYDGKVAIIDFTDINVTGSMDLWILEDWKKEEWLKKTFVFQPSHMHLLRSTAGNRYLPKSTTLKDKVILIPDTYPCYILCYDLQTNYWKKIYIKGIPKFDGNKYIDMVFMDVSESIVYLQTY